MSTDQSRTLRRNVLGVPGIAFFVISANGPMAAVLGAAPLVFLSVGAGAPGVYALSAVLFVIFAAGYVAMSRYIGNAGGFVTYVARAFDRRIGTSAALVALLTYVAMLCALYGAYAVFAHQTFVDQFGIDLPWQAWAVGTLALVGLLTYNRTELSVRILGPLMLAECLVILVLDIAIVVSGGSGGDAGLSFVGFDPSNVFVSGFGVALLFALASFGGFEATVVFSEEAKDPRRTIPRAVYVVITFIGAFYAFSAWALMNAVGADRIQKVAADDPTGFVYGVANEYIGTAWSDIMSILVVTSFFAILLGVTNMLSRYVFALGRARVLPAAFSATHSRHQAPHVGALVTSVVALIVIGAFMIGGLDPFNWLYVVLIAVSQVALLTMLCGASLAVVVFFWRRGRQGEGLWRTVIAPAISCAAFAGAIYLAVDNWDVLTVGLPGVAKWLWVLVPVVAIVGYVIGAVREDKLDFRHVTDDPLPAAPDVGADEHQPAVVS